MIFYQRVLVILLISMVKSSLQYDTHESVEEDFSEEAEPKIDYTKYFGEFPSQEDAPGRVSALQASGVPLGFVQPYNVAYVLPGGHFGPVEFARQSVPLSEELIQSSALSFPVNKEEVKDNNTGFVDNNVKFQSLSDASSSATENGLRPQNFPPHVQNEESSHGNYFSPGPWSLEEVVDREIDYVKRDEQAFERERKAGRKQLNEKDDGDGLDSYESFEFDINDSFESSADSESSNKQQENSHENSTSEENSKYSKQSYLPYENQYKASQPYTPEYRSRPLNKKNQPCNCPDTEDSSDPSSKENDHNSDEEHQKSLKPKPQSLNYHKNQHNYPTTNQLPTAVIKSYPTFYHRSIYPPQLYVNSRSYLPRGRAFYHITNNNYKRQYIPAKRTLVQNPRSLQGNNLSNRFKPSPRDSYLDSIQNPANGKAALQDLASIYPTPKLIGSHSIPNPDYSDSVSHHKTEQPHSYNMKKKKLCKKVQKKFDKNPDVIRYEPQRMTCYTCTNEEKGNTYEECTYESEPKIKSFHKSTSEAHVPKTATLPTSNFRRKRREVENSFKRLYTSKPSNKKPKTRKIRQYDYSFESFEKDPKFKNENYGFNYDNRNRAPLSEENSRTRFQLSPDSSYEFEGVDSGYEDDFFDGDDSDDKSDIEKEYSPTGASQADECHTVKKRGMSCLVCENSKTGGSYEQCSYASDPKSNKYLYSKQSSYGSKRKPNNDRYKRHRQGSNREKYKKDSLPTKLNNVDRRKEKNYIPKDHSQKLKGKEDTSRGPKEDVDETRIIKIQGVERQDPLFRGNLNQSGDIANTSKNIKRRNEDSENFEKTAETSKEYDFDESGRESDDSFIRYFPEFAISNLSIRDENNPRPKPNNPNNNYDEIRNPGKTNIMPNLKNKRENSEFGLQEDNSHKENKFKKTKPQQTSYMTVVKHKYSPKIDHTLTLPPMNKNPERLNPKESQSTLPMTDNEENTQQVYEILKTNPKAKISNNGETIG